MLTMMSFLLQSCHDDVPHFYCIDCESYLGPSQTAPKYCSSCKAKFDIDQNLMAGSYFLLPSLANQLVDVFIKTRDTTT